MMLNLRDFMLGIEIITLDWIHGDGLSLDRGKSIELFQNQIIQSYMKLIIMDEYDLEIMEQ